LTREPLAIFVALRFAARRRQRILRA